MSVIVARVREAKSWPVARRRRSSPLLGFLLTGAGLNVAQVPLLMVDIWIGNGHGELKSRVIPTHEYGHYALCSMLFDRDWFSFAETYGKAALDSLTSSPTADSQFSFDNEAFADFIAGQVVGGELHRTVRGIQRERRRDLRCRFERMLGTELPHGGSPDFYAQVSRVATTMHDAFDGHFAPHGAAGLNADQPSDGGAWTRGGPPALPDYIHSPTHGGDAQDENVALPGPALHTFVNKLSGLDQETFLSSLATTMLENHFSWCEVCRVFAIHTPAGGAGNLVTICTSDPVRDWMPRPPVGETCGQGLNLQCPAGTFRLDSTCVATCPAGYAPNGDICELIVR